jgi:putative endopeptidase
MKFSPYLWLAVPAVFAVSCKNKPTLSEAPARTVFFDKTGMDTTVKPGDDFFSYASGAWMKKTEIPASETGWGSFYTLHDDNQKNIHKILDELTQLNNPAGSKEQKVADFYTSGMDTAAIEKLGYEPVKPLLAKIDAVKDYKQLLDLSAEGFKDGDGFLFGLYVGPDDKISTKNAVSFSQAGLGLPNRDYYFKTDSNSVKIRKAYVKYIAKLFTLTGVDTASAAKQANDILKLETQIANSHSTPVELRDPVKNYNKFAVSAFQTQIPDIDLKNVLGKMGIKTDTVLVGQPKYYVALDGLLKSQPIEV